MMVFVATGQHKIVVTDNLGRLPIGIETNLTWQLLIPFLIIGFLIFKFWQLVNSKYKSAKEASRYAIYIEDNHEY
jgi:hypothetical protein